MVYKNLKNRTNHSMINVEQDKINWMTELIIAIAKLK